MGNCFLLLACLLFSFACNLIKKIYEDKAYTSTIYMLQNVFISGIAGFIFSLFFSEFIFHPILIILFSGIGGFLGVKGLAFMIQSKFDTIIDNDSKFMRIFNNIFDIAPNESIYTIHINNIIKNQYSAKKYLLNDNNHNIS